MSWLPHHPGASQVEISLNVSIFLVLSDSSVIRYTVSSFSLCIYLLRDTELEWFLPIWHLYSIGAAKFCAGDRTDKSVFLVTREHYSIPPSLRLIITLNYNPSLKGETQFLSLTPLLPGWMNVIKEMWSDCKSSSRGRILSWLSRGWRRWAPPTSSTLSGRPWPVSGGRWPGSRQGWIFWEEMQEEKISCFVQKTAYKKSPILSNVSLRTNPQFSPENNRTKYCKVKIFFMCQN